MRNQQSSYFIISLLFYHCGSLWIALHRVPFASTTHAKHEGDIQQQAGRQATHFSKSITSD
jgi:hypothetical protein